MHFRIKSFENGFGQRFWTLSVRQWWVWWRPISCLFQFEFTSREKVLEVMDDYASRERRDSRREVTVEYFNRPRYSTPAKD